MMPTVCVFNRTRESFLCLSALATGTAPVPARGVPVWFRNGLRKMAGEDGIWLMPCAGVYNVGTLFPVDRVYLDRGNRVIQLVEHLDPLQIVQVRWPHASVLEVRTRTIHSSRTRVGDELLICSPEDVQMQWEEFRGEKAWRRQEVVSCSRG